MKTIEKVVTGFVIVGVIALVSLFFLNGKKNNDVNVSVGASPGSSFNQTVLTVNGVEQAFRSQSFNQASTTRCALRSPTNATSTLSTDGIIKSASTTDYTLAIYKGATPYSATTLIRSESVTANGQVAFPTASSTYNSLADTNRTFAPGEYLVVTAGSTATAMDFGTCSAVFNVGTGK